jgi:hypothetical protein
MEDVAIKLQRRESDGGEVYDTSWDDLMSQATTSGNMTLIPTK